jgi:NADH:ubiquinone oxidoreductase subunit F (NADH-binding)
MHWGLPWSCSGLASSTGAGSNGFSRSGSTWSIIKNASTRHQYKCNAWDAKSNMLHDREQLNHLNPYKLFTKLLLAFLVFG